MAESFLQVAPDSSGQKVAVQTITRGADTVVRQEVVFGDPTGDDSVAKVTNTDAAAADYGIVARRPDPEVTTGAVTLDAVDEAATLELKGRRVVGVHIASGATTAVMKLIVEHSTNGTDWGERFFWNGDNWVVFDILPHPLNPRRWYSVSATPGIKYIRVRVQEYTSGSVVAHVFANDQDDVTMYGGLGAIQDGPVTFNSADDAVYGYMYKNTVGFFVEAGNLVGTLVVEGSPTTQGSVWVPTVFFANSQWRLGTGYAVSSPATGFTVSPLLDQGFARYRLRVSAYTSGSCVAHARVAGTEASGNRMISKGVAAVAAPFFAELIGGKDAAGALQALAMSNTHPTGTEQALLIRDRLPPIYNFLIPSQVHVAAANTVHWDLFNADAALVVRVLSILQIPNITTAVTGVVFDWLLERTTAVGTGGSALTAWLADLSQTALDADITARSKPSGGATASTDLFRYSISSEETQQATIQIASQGGLEIVPPALRPPLGQGIVLRQNQGIRCVQETNSNAGNTGWLISLSATT